MVVFNCYIFYRAETERFNSTVTYLGNIGEDDLQCHSLWNMAQRGKVEAGNLHRRLKVLPSLTYNCALYLEL